MSWGNFQFVVRRKEVVVVFDRASPVKREGGMCTCHRNVGSCQLTHSGHTAGKPRRGPTQYFKEARTHKKMGEKRKYKANVSKLFKSVMLAT